MTTHDRASLLNAEPVGLTQKELLLRLDARMDAFEPRVRKLEDAALVTKTEARQTKRYIAAGFALVPIVMTFILRVVFPA